MSNYLNLFDSQEKAIDHAMWLNFKHRIAGIVFGVIHGPENNWAVCEEATVKEMEMEFFDILPNDYSELNYKKLDIIRQDKELLPHWEELFGTFSTLDGEILRFMLYSKIPLEKFIRYELASRGFDEKHYWCGFEKASEIWLK